MLEMTQKCDPARMSRLSSPDGGSVAATHDFSGALAGPGASVPAVFPAPNATAERQSHTRSVVVNFSTRMQ
jgi:hypothetical protein